MLGHARGLETDVPNFTSTARVADPPADAPPRAKFGVTVRAGLAGTDTAVHLRYDALATNPGLQWFMRYHVTPDTHDGSQRCYHAGTDTTVTNPKGLWLRLVRRYPYVDVFASADGKAWRPAADYRPVPLPQKVHVGLQATAGGPADAKRTIDVASITSASPSIPPTPIARPRPPSRNTRPPAAPGA